MKAILFKLSVVLCFLFTFCTSRYNSTIGRKLVIKDPTVTNHRIPSRSKPQVKDQLSAFKESPQIFNICTLHDTVIVGFQGTKIEIHAYCLTDEKGEAVQGNAKVELKELYSKKDMILNNKPTMSNGKLLESNGEIYLNATMNGKPLFIGCPEGLQVALKTPYMEDMIIWTGKIDNNGDLNWIEDETIKTVNEKNESEEKLLSKEGDYNSNEYEGEMMWYTSSVENYLFTTQKFGWINCDRFYEDQREKASMYVQIKNPFPKEYRTYVYALFPGINSVMQLYSNDGESYLLSNVPEGEVIDIVCLSETELKTYFSITNSIITKGHKEIVELQPMVKDEIKKALEYL